MQFGTLHDSRICYVLFIILSSLVHRSSQEPNKQRDTKAVLDKLMDSYGTKVIRPNGQNMSDDPVNVTVNIKNLDITSISDYDMEFGVKMLFRQEWFDSRLTYERQGNIEYITLTDTSKIWKPDLFFTNEKDAHHHNIMAPNVFIRIYPSGKVLYSARISLTLICHMHLQRFPFDSQTCHFGIESYAYTASDIELNWKEDILPQTSKQNSVVGFKFTNLNTNKLKVVTDTGEFWSLRLCMNFHRELKYYIYHTFLPSSVLVAVTWGAFLLDRHEVLIRSIIALCALFGLGSITAEIEATVPHVDYVKAMDIWVFGCFAFLFAALMEFSFVGTKRVEGGVFNDGEIGTATTPVVDMNLQPTRESSHVKEQEIQNVTKCQRHPIICLKDLDRIDSLASRIFPGLFLVFSSLYFITFYS